MEKNWGDTPSATLNKLFGFKCVWRTMKHTLLIKSKHSLT